MNRQRALEILRASPLPAGSPGVAMLISESPPSLTMSGAGMDVVWFSSQEAKLDGWFTADQLEAIAWWMRTGGKDDTP